MNISPELQDKCSFSAISHQQHDCTRFGLAVVTHDESVIPHILSVNSHSKRNRIHDHRIECHLDIVYLLSTHQRIDQSK